MQGIRAGRPEAAAAIWSWREGAERAASADTRAIRLRGVLRSLAGAAAGALVFLFLSRTMGGIVLAIAAALALAALVSPTGAYAVAERAFATLGGYAGRLMSWLVLPILFYGVFVPFGVLFRRGEKDALQRFYAPGKETYWSDRSSGRTASLHRERQY